MTDRQQLRRLAVVNGITACLLMAGLALESRFIPAIVLLLLTFSFVGSVLYLTKPPAITSIEGEGGWVHLPQPIEADFTEVGEAVEAAMLSEKSWPEIGEIAWCILARDREVTDWTGAIGSQSEGERG